MLAEEIPKCVPLIQNTDGLEMMIPRQYKERYLEICAEWEKTTNLQLEHDEYKKIILADVNYWHLNLENCWNANPVKVCQSAAEPRNRKVQRLSKLQLC